MSEGGFALINDVQINGFSLYIYIYIYIYTLIDNFLFTGLPSNITSPCLGHIGSVATSDTSHKPWPGLPFR